ncbi:UNVERIFIED_CONTAM: ATP synthase subunit a [Sesamum latifolium]|uniref:F-ATPase protein 6 n=1 Tax=Sesamum latifolium TaxID=2727402 RepID=A0AAW2S556_9LAMI
MTRLSLIHSSPDAIAMLEPDRSYDDFPFQSAVPGRLKELQAEIGEKFREAVKSAGDERLFSKPEDYIAAIEQLHGESESIEFLQSISDDLVKNGANGETYKEGIQMWIDLMMSSPLDQFSILPLIPMKIGDLYFSFTNPSLFMLLTLSLVLLFVYFVTKKGGGNSVPNAWQSLVELIYDFVPNLVNEQIGGLSGNVKQKFFPCISVTFTFSLFRNLQGDPGPLFIVLALTGLELGVAISQAHVSTISICIYLNDATNLHQSAYLFIIEEKRGTESLDYWLMIKFLLVLLVEFLPLALVPVLSRMPATTSNSLRLNSRFNQCRYNILRGQSIPGKELALAKDCSLLGEISLLCRTDVPPGGRETHPAEEKKLCTGTSAGHKPTSTEMVAGKLNSGGGLSSISCLVSGTGFISFKRKHIIRPRWYGFNGSPLCLFFSPIWAIPEITSVQDLVTQRGCLFSLPFLRMVLLFFWGLFRELFPQLGKYLFSKFGVFGLVVLIEYRDHPVSAKPGVQQPTIAPQHLTKERDRDDIDEIPLHVGIVWEPTWKALPSHGAVKRWMKGRSSRKKPWKSASVLWSPEVFVPFSPDCDDKVMDQLKIVSTLSKNLLDLIMIMGPSTFSTILPKYMTMVDWVRWLKGRTYD